MRQLVPRFVTRPYHPYLSRAGAIREFLMTLLSARIVVVDDVQTTIQNTSRVQILDWWTFTCSMPNFVHWAPSRLPGRAQYVGAAGDTTDDGQIVH